MTVTKSKSFVCTTVFVWIVGLMVLPLLNYYIDQPVIFHNGDSYYVKPKLRTENRRYSRMIYLKNHPVFTKFFAGNSRIGHGMPVKELGDNWHKLAFPGGNIHEYLWNLKLLQQWGMLPEEVLLNIDHMVLFKYQDWNRDYFMRSMPGSSLADRWDELKFFLFRTPSFSDWEYLVRGKLAHNKWPEIRGAYKENRDPDSVLVFPPLSSNTPNQLPWVLRDVEKMKKICPTTPVITPCHYKTLLYSNFTDLYTFNYLLAQLGPFWDFRPLSSPLLIDNSAWSEISHFNTKLGMPLAKRLKGQPGKVGKWVTPEKVTEDFQNMVWDIQRQIPALLQKDKQVRINSTLLGPVVYRMNSPENIHNVSNVQGAKGRFTFFAQEAPYLILPRLEGGSGEPMVMQVKLKVPEKTELVFQVGSTPVYRRDVDTMQSMQNVKKNMKFGKYLYHPKDVQEIDIPITRKQLAAQMAGAELRLILGGVRGRYELQSLAIRPIRSWQVPFVDPDMAAFCLSTKRLRSSGRFPDFDIKSIMEKSRNVRFSPGGNAQALNAHRPEIEFETDAAKPGRDRVVMLEMDVKQDLPVRLSWCADGDDFSSERSTTKILRRYDKNKRVFLRAVGAEQSRYRLTIGYSAVGYRFRNLEIRDVSSQPAKPKLNMQEQPPCPVAVQWLLVN